MDVEKFRCEPTSRGVCIWQAGTPSASAEFPRLAVSSSSYLACWHPADVQAFTNKSDAPFRRSEKFVQFANMPDRFGYNDWHFKWLGTWRDGGLRCHKTLSFQDGVPTVVLHGYGR